MTFSVLAVRTGEEPETALYPDPGDGRSLVEPEPADGQQPAIYQVSSIHVFAWNSGSSQQLAKVVDISANLIVTNSRVSVACSKFIKGGGWGGWGVGGLAVAATANVVSKARAARKRRGKMLVGHIRYEWLTVIHTTDRAGLFGKNRLEIACDDPTGENRSLVLDLELDKHQPASAVAEAIMRRAASYRAQQAADETHRTALATYGASPTYDLLPDKKRRYRLPTH